MTTDRRDNKSQNFFYRKYNERVPDPARSAYTMYQSWMMPLALAVPALLLEFLSREGIVRQASPTAILLTLVFMIVLMAMWIVRIERVYFDNYKIVYARSKWWCAFFYKRTEIQFADIASVRVTPSRWRIPSKRASYRYLEVRLTLRDGRKKRIVFQASFEGSTSPYTLSEPRSEQCYKLLREKLQELNLL